ncbi:SDR family oxidoreductase [Saccharothrix sp. Mg75]|uniref:SDR family oxidoreductase n=1 Tax=Saccharothrix sp. Mg75 TaxID=3445357 RepID=UPI003EECA3C8
MSDEHRYLVIGSQGFQGGAVARHLLSEGLDVRGFAKEGGTPAPGAPELPTAFGDLADAAAVRAAFEGVTHASVVLPLVYDTELVVTYATNVVDAARAAGVRRLVFNTNTPLPAEKTGYASYETRRAAEEVLNGSGLPLVVVRPPVYLDNLFSPWNGPALVNDGVLAYPLAVDRKVAWVSHADLAVATGAALRVPDIEGAVVPLGGPAAVTGPELARAFGTALEREVTYLPLEVPQFETGLAQVIGPDAAAGVAGIYHWAALGHEPELFAPDHAEVERVLGVSFPGITAWAAAQPWDVWAGVRS